MTKKAMKLLFAAQIKSALWFLGIYCLIIAILSHIFHYIENIDLEWMSISAVYAPKIYLLVIGIVYPLINLEQYVSCGLTRMQYFKAFAGVIGILSLLLLIPTLIAEVLLGTLTPLTVLLNIVQLPVFFLAGWSAGAGFKFETWYAAFLGILSAIACFQIMNAVTVALGFPLLVQLITAVLLLCAQLILLPRVIIRIPIKS